MAEFLRYLREGIGESSLVERIDQAVKKARDHVEWRTEYMSLQLKLYDIWDEARDEGLEAGREQGLLEGREQGLLEGRLEGQIEGKMQQLFELVDDNLLSIEEAVRRTELTREDFLTKMKEYIRCE